MCIYVYMISRVHNISRERVCLTAYIPCTNALRLVSLVNYRILRNLLITVVLIGDDRLGH